MSNKENLGRQVASGLFWKFGERIIAQGVSFLISLVLARILLPEQYGTVSLVLVFINIANVFVSDGLGESLIQKRDSNDEDFSTMFFCSLITGVVLYIILFLVAPLIERFYGTPGLTLVIRILSLQVPLSAIKTIQHAYVQKNMLFKKFFFSTLGGTLLSGIIGIVIAYKGFGVWALVEQYLVNSVMDLTILFITVKWRPHLKFSIQSAKQLLSYGWKLLVAQFINVIYNESRSLVIGKVYSEKDLAYYNRGSHFPSMIITNINTSISTVLFPAMSKVNKNPDDVKQLTRKSMKMTSYVIFPMMIGMFSVAETMIRVLLTDKWLLCVPFLRLSCIYWMFQPCQTANVQAIKAVGRSDICLKLEVVKKTIGFMLVLFFMRINVFAVVASNVLFAVISTIVNIIPNKRLINYGFVEQLVDLVPAALLSIVMGVAVYGLSFLGLSDFLTLIIQIIVGVVIYILGSVIFKLESFNDLKKLIKR